MNRASGEPDDATYTRDNLLITLRHPKGRVPVVIGRRSVTSVKPARAKLHAPIFRPAVVTADIFKVAECRLPALGQ